MYPLVDIILNTIDKGVVIPSHFAYGSLGNCEKNWYDADFSIFSTPTESASKSIQVGWKNG